MAIDVVAVADAGLGNSAYLVDLGDGSALLVEPQRVTAPYERAAGERGLRIRVVAETHLHADFVSGGCELAALGAELIVPAAGGYAFDHRGVGDGDEADLGGLTLRAIATPGHTPEHLAYLLADGATPVAVFSGGTLIAGGVARPDLIAADQTERLARAAYRSITERLLTLPDDLPVYPTHGGGSFCSTGATGRHATTIGQERAANPLLQAPDEDAFVARLLGGLGSYPEYFLHLREVNRTGPAVYGRDLPRLRPLTAAATVEAVAGGAVLVDARPIDRFAAGHVPGSVSIELRGQFATWLGWIVPFGTPVVVVIGDDQDEHDLVAQALMVGYDGLVGRLDGGIAAWTAAGHDIATLPLVDHGDVGDTRLLDVRQTSEWTAGHAPGALHRELGTLRTTGADVPDGVTVHCAHGQRAMAAASLLRRAGHRDVTVTTAAPDQLTTTVAPKG